MVALAGGIDFESPVMVKVKQHFECPTLGFSEIEDSVQKQFLRPEIKDKVKPGMKVAIAVGSRGIAKLSFVVKQTIQLLREFGANPVIVPAMGSHGGATAEGQQSVLAGYGITEDEMGVPVLPSMETVQLGTFDGVPVYFSKVAYECDLIVSVCRVKPHTDFRGEVESGAYKMLTIGLGKHLGAATLHSAGYARFPKLIPGIGQFIVDHAPVGFAVCIIENSFDDVGAVEVLAADAIAVEEPKLLKLAKDYLPKFNIDTIDLLIVDELGKNISGQGMDPNITGRSPFGLEYSGTPQIDRIAVLDLTEETHGNATGIGVADFITVDCFNKIDLQATYANTITAGAFGSAKMPMMLANDKELLAVALKAATLTPPNAARIVRIKDTLHLGEFWVSEVIATDLEEDSRFSVTSEHRPLTFDTNGKLTW